MSASELETYLVSRPPDTSGAAGLPNQLADLKTALRKLETAVIPEGVSRIESLNEQFDQFAARVSLIGQVKAGKTALANGLLGLNGLLPSDVNPWTSVVTSMHVNIAHPKGKKAIFQFFSQDDWNTLVEDGGRIADLARKAKFDTKLSELTQQIKDMKRRTETRLGRDFKVLLGNQHSFSEYDTDLIKRYVCLGEEDMLAETEGRFADLTKSADLYLASDDFGYPVTIADTPGVNDPFLIREAATLDNLGTSHICVVVLSAHQALSTVDIGLMRILSSLKSEQIVVFVNRIDELSDPDPQIKEIDAYIQGMLAQQNLPAGIPVIYGSALWAEAAIAGDLGVLTEDSLEALQNVVTARTARLPMDATDSRNIDNLVDVSGLSALRTVIDEKIAGEVFAPFIEGLATQATQLGEQSAMYLHQTSRPQGFELSADQILDAIEDVESSQIGLKRTIEKKRAEMTETLKFSISGAYREFIHAEKRTLRRHLETGDPIDHWSPDTQALRKELNAAYTTFCREVQTFFNDTGRRLADELSFKFVRLLGKDAKEANITAPSLSPPGIPLSLMRTLTVDLSSGIMSGWIKRKLNRSGYLTKFEELALADMRDTLEEIEKENLATYYQQSQKAMDEFLADHLATLTQLSELTDAERRAELQKRLGVGDEVAQRLASIAAALELLAALGGAQLPSQPAAAAGG